MRRGLEGIAKKLGLSIATISRALNPSTEYLVKEKTKKRIFDLVQKEGFKPNIKARFLAKMKLNNIVLALPIGVNSIFYDEYYNGIIKGINSVLINTEYNLVILPIQSDYNAEQIYRLLINTETAGLILSPYCKYVRFPITFIKKCGFPIIAIDNKISGKNCYNIILDHKNAGYMAAKQIWEAGYRNIVLISDIKHSEHSELRKSGFYEFFEKTGKKILHNINNIEEPLSYISGLPALKKISEINKFPVCVFSINDEIAVGILNNLRNKNLSCPGDIALLGFDGLSIGEYITPKLSSVAFSFEEIGRRAASLLVDIFAKKHTMKNIILQASIKNGQTF